MKQFLVLLGGMLGLFVVVGGAKTILDRTGIAMDSFDITCGTTATAVANPDGRASTSMRCSNLSSTPVHIGGPDVADDVGYALCADPATCHDRNMNINSNNGYCIVASGTQLISCVVVVE